MLPVICKIKTTRILARRLSAALNNVYFWQQLNFVSTEHSETHYNTRFFFSLDEIIHWLLQMPWAKWVLFKCIECTQQLSRQHILNFLMCNYYFTLLHLTKKRGYNPIFFIRIRRDGPALDGREPSAVRRSVCFSRFLE